MVKPRRYRSVVHKLLIYVAGMLLCASQRMAAQNIDSVVTSASRSPISIADEIKDPAERSAFVAILKPMIPQKLLALSRSFLVKYPRSAFLAPAAEAAARSSFDLGDLKSGLDYAHFSLSCCRRIRCCWLPSPMSRLLCSRTRRPCKRPRCSRLFGSVRPPSQNPGARLARCEEEATGNGLVRHRTGAYKRGIAGACGRSSSIAPGAGSVRT